MQNEKMLHLLPIGTVVNGVDEETDFGWESVTSIIKLGPQLHGGLEGLHSFSHALVIYWMHLSTFDTAEHLVRRARGRSDMPQVGAFAQRAKHRPNPIGVTAVEVLSVSADELSVRGLDAINATPVLDIKPYVPAFDRRDGNVPEWMDRLMEGYFGR